MKRLFFGLESAVGRARASVGVVAVLFLAGVGACTSAEGESRTSAASAGASSESSAQPASAPAPAPMPPAGHAWVIFGADTVLAEVAATPEERADGLMYREELPDGTGMLFVFQTPAIQSFWMANTYIPLDIAYMDASYRITDILQMEPLDTGSYPSTRPALFALEVIQGWFEEKGIEVGAQANIVFGVQGRR